MLYGQDYVFASPFAFRDVMIRHQDDRTQRSIDLLALEFALYNHSGLTLSQKSQIRTRTSRWCGEECLSPSLLEPSETYHTLINPTPTLSPLRLLARFMYTRSLR